MRIAVIEDERPIREGLVHILNKISPEYQVVGSAENGREGLILLEEQDPDLILLDIQMPDMNGLQMLKKKKKRGSIRSKNSPRILFAKARISSGSNDIF